MKKSFFLCVLFLGLTLLLVRPATAQVGTPTATGQPLPPPAGEVPETDSVEVGEMEEDSVVVEQPGAVGVGASAPAAPAAGAPAPAGAAAAPVAVVPAPPVAPAAPAAPVAPVAPVPVPAPAVADAPAAPVVPDQAAPAPGVVAAPAPDPVADLAAPAPVVATAASARPSGMLQSLTNTLMLNDFQALALRRALADSAADGAARQRLWAALTPAQQARLLAWEVAHPAAPRLALP